MFSPVGVAVDLGQDAILSCQATAYPTPDYYWEKVIQIDYVWLADKQIFDLTISICTNPRTPQGFI